MKTFWKWPILFFTLVLGSCAQLPLNGIVTITPLPAPVQANPTIAFTASSVPSTPTKWVETQTPNALPLPETNTPGAPTQVPETQIPLVSSTPTSADLQGMVGKARLDLSKRLFIPEADITLIQASQVSWADSSLGCPQPGLMYAQMVTPGYLVILQAGSSRYDYHAGSDQTPFYCSNPQTPIEVNPGEI